MEGKTFHRLDGVYRLVTDPVIRQRVGRTGLFTTVLLVVFGLITSAALPQFTLGETGSASANRLWSSGAELNSTTADMEFTSSSGTVSISSSTKRSGDYAYRANPTSSTGLFYKTWANSTQSNKFWFRIYLRVATAPSADTYVMQVGSGASGKISVRLTTSSTLQLRNEEDNTNIGSASSALSTNTWYRLEVYVDTTTLSSTDAELRLDGVSISSSTAENLAAAIDRLTWGSSATGTTDLFFDDIAINDNAGRAADNWPGEGKIVHMQPNADGDNTAWTGYPSDTNDYDDVDEITPNDDTDTNYETTTNDTDDYNLESASNAGIGANDYVKLASVGVRVQACGSAPGGPECISGEGGVNVNYRTRIKATSGGTVEETNDIGIDDLYTSSWLTNDDDSAKLNKLTVYDLPGTSTAPWTITELDTAQIGVKNISTHGYNVTAIWLQVEYVDRSGGRMISSGFELNSAAAGMEISAVTSTPAISSSTFRSGAYSLQTENSGGQEYARFYFESTNTSSDYYLRSYMYIATAFNGSTATVLSLLDTSNLRRAYIRMTTSRTLELWDEDGQIGSASSVLSTSTWYRIELRMNTSPSAGSHVVDGRIDGSSFASASNRSIGTGVARIGIGVNASDSLESSSNTTGDLLWDDVALNKGIGISQNSWPGAGAIIHLRPNADDSTNTAWTNGFGNVDEVTPNDATDVVSETTSGDIDDYDLDASSIGASDVVNLVSVGVRFRTSSATQEDFRVRVKDTASGIAIESNTLSPASTTWTTNATADPKLYPLTAYTLPERSTAWTDAELDTAQVGLRNVLSSTGTVEVTAAWLLVDYSPPATITISGTCDQYDQTTDCTDDGANQFRVAVGASLQAQVDTTVDGAWSITGVTQPATGAIITVFIDGETTDNEEAVAVAKYDGTGDVTGVVLFQRHLSIGSADNQTLSNSDIDDYDNSVSADEDIFFDVSAGNDLTVDSLASYTDEEIYTVASNTFRPASAGGADVTTVHVENDGTWTNDTNVITVNGNWQNDGTFSAGTGSVTMNSTTTGRTLSGTMTGTSAFYDLIFNGSGGAWSFSAAAETDRDFTITNGTVTAPSGNLTIARNFTNDATFTHNSGTVVLDTTTTATVSGTSSATTFNNFTSTTATKTIQFKKHTTGTPVFTFAGTFTITGTAGNLINIYSDTSGTQWKAHFNAHQYSVSYANIRDGGCDTGTYNVYLSSDSTSVSNNDTCWVFPINRLWSGGAELQSATAEVETNFNDGASQSISTSTKRSGEASWRVNTTSSNSAFNKYYVNTPTQGKYWARFYIYVASAPNTEVGVFNFNGSSTRISVRMNTDRSIELWNEEDNLQIGSASSALSASTWYRVEVYHDTTTLASTSAELRLNGSTVASGTANLAGASDRIQWGVLEAAGTADLYFDDIAVNGPSSAADNWPGEGKIVHMQPNADGDNVAWTDLGGNAVDYDEVDEITPNDGTDYIHSSSGGNLEDVNLESASSAGIGSSDTITAVSVGLRFRACNSGGACLVGSGDNYKARIKASGGGTLEESASINTDNLSYLTNANTASATANLYPLTLLDLPGSSASKWTPTNLDSAQIGMNHASYENGFRTTAMWLLVEYIPVASVTGTCDQYDQTTDCTDDGANEIKVAVNGTLQSGADTTVDGSWSVPITTPNTGDVITVFINGESTDSEEANAVTVYDGSGDITGVTLFQRHLTIGSADNQTITNTNLSQYDNSVSSDEDIFFDVSAGNDLTVDSLASYTDEELYTVASNTFRPASGGGADVTTVHVENDGTWTADSNAISVGGNWQNDSVFDAGTSTVTFTATDTDNTLSGTLSYGNGDFYALTFNGSGGQWSVNATTDVASALTMTAGTIVGTSSITVSGNVTGAGTINLTGGTFEHNGGGPRDFGTTSGSANWTFAALTFSNTSGVTGVTFTTQTGGSGTITVTDVLRVGKSGNTQATTLNAGNRTWTLSGGTTAGDPFQILASPAGVLTASTSTFTYTGTYGLGNMTVQSATYNNLSINNGSETYILEGTTNCNGNFDSTAGTLDTTSANNYAMTVTGNWTMASGSTVVANASTITVSGNWDQNNTSWNTAATGSGTSTVVLSGASKTLSTTGTSASDRHFYNLTVNGTYTKTAGERINIYNNFIMNTSSALAEIEFSPGGLHIWSGTATVTINGNLSKASGTGSMFIRTSMPTITSSVGINVRVDYYMDAVGTHVIPALDYNGGLLFLGNENNTFRLAAGTFNIGSLGDHFSMSNGTTGKTSTVDNSTNNATVNVTQDVIFSSANGSITFNMGSASYSVGRGWQNADSSTVNPGTSTVTMSNTTNDGDITSAGQSFNNLIIDDTGDDITIIDALTVTNDLTMTAGDLNGTQNVTVNGTVQGTAGTITMTGGTFEQRVIANENFGTTSGSAAWTFNDLTFSASSVIDSWWTITTQTGGTGGITVTGIMRVNRATGANDNDGIILTGGNRTWTLSGTSGNPLRMETTDFGGFIGQITPGSSTFTYTGNNAGGNTTVEQNPSGVGYYNLDINNSSETFVTEGNTTVGNDLTVTNGVLSTTGSNHSLTVTRDLTLSNTAGVGLTANASTITVSRHFNDTGDKLAEGTSSLILNGTGTLTAASSENFYNISWGYSSFTTTSNNIIFINGTLTLNGGTVTGAGGLVYFPCSTSCQPVIFSSPTTITGSNVFIYRATANNAAFTITGGNYGGWAQIYDSQNNTGTSYSLAGNITHGSNNRANILRAGNSGSTTFNSNNYSITAGEWKISDSSNCGSTTTNWGSSTVSLISTTNSITLTTTNCGSHTLNLGSSNVDVKGNVSFVNGTGTIAVNPGTSTVTWTHSSGSKTYTPNNQSLYHVVVNAGSDTAQVDLSGNADFNGNLTVSGGQLDTVSGSNYSIDTFDVTMSGTATIVANAASITVRGNWISNTTWNSNIGTSTVIFTGTSKSIDTSGTGGSTRHFYKLTINSGASINVAGSELVHTDSDVNIQGTLNITAGCDNGVFYYGGTGTTLTVGASGVLGGSGGCFSVMTATPTYSYSGTINVSSFRYQIASSTTIPAYTYGGNLYFRVTSGSPTYTIGAGTMNVSYSWTNENTSTGTLTVDNSVNNTNFTVDDAFSTISSSGSYAFTMGSATYDINGNWNDADSASFTNGTSTVLLSGTGTQTVSRASGTNTFYNLQITNNSGGSASDCERTGFTASVDFSNDVTVTNNLTFTTANTRVEFDDGNTYTFNNINWNGQASGTRVYFRNSAASGSWNLNVSGTQTAVSYVNVSRSNASSGNTIQAANGTNTDCGNNVNWSFNNPGNPSSLAQKKTNDTVISTGGWINETSVKFTATITDGDSNNIQICVEKDVIGVAFSNTEDFCGSLVTSGSTATLTISSLSDNTQYHWQARSKDSAGYYSSWVSYGGNSDPSDRDFGIDTIGCVIADGTYDGSTIGVDAAYNDGSLTSLSANWESWSCSVSGLNYYEYAIGTTLGGTDIKNWTNNGTSTSFTATGLVLRTNQRYYTSVKGWDNAGNVNGPEYTDGQDVLPTISMTMGSTTITFSNLNDSNNRTDSKTLNLTTSTNAYGGYVIRQYATGVLTSGSFTIPMFQGGTYTSPGSWPGGFCTGGSNCGYGYTSNDTTIQGSNKFSSGTLFASFATAAFGDIVADHTTAVDGSTGAVSNEAFTITHKVSVDALQAAKNYQTEVLYIVTGTF